MKYAITEIPLIKTAPNRNAVVPPELSGLNPTASHKNTPPKNPKNRLAKQEVMKHTAGCISGVSVPSPEWNFAIGRIL
jgi:hypothetical protein